MFGSSLRRLDLKSSMASVRVWALSLPQKKKKLSGRVLTYIIDSSASLGGGMGLSLISAIFRLKSVCARTLFLSDWERKLIKTMFGSCLGEEKPSQPMFNVPENQIQSF